MIWILIVIPSEAEQRLELAKGLQPDTQTSLVSVSPPLDQDREIRAPQKQRSSQGKDSLWRRSRSRTHRFNIRIWLLEDHDEEWIRDCKDLSNGQLKLRVSTFGSGDRGIGETP